MSLNRRAEAFLCRRAMVLRWPLRFFLLVKTLPWLNAWEKARGRMSSLILIANSTRERFKHLRRRSTPNVSVIRKVKSIPLILYGAGGHGKVVLDAALCLGIPVMFVVDDNPISHQLLGVPILSSSRRESLEVGVGQVPRNQAR